MTIRLRKLLTEVSRGGPLGWLLRAVPWVVVALVVLGNLGLLYSAAVRTGGLADRLEWATYDWRMRIAARLQDQSGEADRQMGLVSLSEACLRDLAAAEELFWPLPRDVYGEVVRELADRGAAVIGMDTLFYEPHWLSWMARQAATRGLVEDGDARFAEALADTKIAILPAGASDLADGPPGVEFPRAQFATNASVAHIVCKPDADGVRRRVQAEMLGREGLRFRKTWHMGVALAARKLGLALDKARITNNTVRIPFRDGSRTERVIPLDRRGNILVNWELTYNDDPPLLTNRFSNVYLGRKNGLPRQGPQDWNGRVVVLASTASGSNIEDRGPSPLNPDDVGGAVIWNVAHSILTNRLVRQSSLPTDTLLIVGLGLLTGFLSWRLGALTASFAVVGIAAVYIGAAVWLFVAYRYWVPIALPVGGALAMTYLFMLSYRLLGEVLLKRRDLAPYVVEVLWPHRLRELRLQPCTATVLFADIRGYTEWLGRQCDEVTECCRRQGMSASVREQVTSGAQLQLVQLTNEYLSRVAECVRNRRGTVDKFMGDCVMAFWGAPVHHRRHREYALQAAIDAQRAIAALNARSGDRPHRLTVELGRGKPPVTIPLQEPARLEFGISIRTGEVRVGAVGDPAYLSNYTVLGRVVNEANHLQDKAGKGRIVCSEEVLEGLDPPVACRDLGTMRIGHHDLNVREVVWEEPRDVRR